MDPTTAFVIAGVGLNLLQGWGAGQDRQNARRIQRAEATANIAMIDDFLARYPEYEEYTKGAYEQAGEQQYRELMKNYGNVNVMAGLTGQVAGGTSIGAVGEEARGDVATFAGEDLVLTGEDGLYGQGYNVLKGQLAAEKLAAEEQRKVFEEVLDSNSWLESDTADTVADAVEEELPVLTDVIKDVFDWFGF